MMPMMIIIIIIIDVSIANDLKPLIPACLSLMHPHSYGYLVSQFHGWPALSLTFGQGVDPQLHLREVPLPDHLPELIEGNAPFQHDVIQHALIVRHVMHGFLEGCQLR